MTRDVRAALLAAVATLMTMLCLVPLLDGRGWLQPVALVVLAVGLSGAAAAAAGLPRWLTPPVSALAGLVITTALLVPNQAALAGFLPTPESVRALGVLLRGGLATVETVLPPAPTDDVGVITLLTLAAGAVAVATLTIAGPLRRPGAAGLPLLLVVCVATALATDGIGVLGYLSAGLGYLAMTLTDADRRVREWGAVLARRGHGGQEQSSGVPERLASVAAVTAVLALGTGAVLPVLTPGDGQDRLQSLVQDEFGGGSGRGGLTTVNPFLDIREDLASQDDTVLIRYATTDPEPDPLRFVTADLFDGNVWVPSQTALPDDQDVAGGLPTPPGASAQVLSAAQQVSTSVGVGPLAQSFLPLPYPPSAVEVEGRWLYDARTLNVGSSEETTEGITYTVTSYDIRPDAAALSAAPPDGLDELWTQLPDTMSEVVLSEAQRVVDAAGAETRYDQALALQQWFRSSGGFTYSLDAPDVTDRDAVEAFLVDRRGYCVQFASTMALMARSLDIPARVAVGFLPGEQVEAGRYEIRADDAHAWPELFFEGVGWVRFEPTPRTRTGQPPGWAVPESDPAVPQPSTPADEAAPLPEDDTRPEAAPPTASERGDGVWADVAAVAVRVLQVLLVVGLVVGALSLPRLWRWWRSRRRLAAAGDDDGARSAVLWTELLERLADRQALPEGSTVREQQADLVRRERLPEPAAQAVARLAEACERALYAVEPAPSQQGPADVATVLRAVSATRDRWHGLGATWFPAPSPDITAPSRSRAGERVG